MKTLDRRRAGVLLHITSLPGPHSNGTLGAEAYRFVDFLARSKVSVWQMLPIGPTHDNLSPYQSLSIHAGNTRLLDPDWVVSKGWLSGFDSALPRQVWIDKAFGQFQQCAAPHCEPWRQFCQQHAHWLDDYALYQALRAAHQCKPWWSWPTALRCRDPAALAQARMELADAMDRQRFAQFLFYQQWLALKEYANRHGILLFGDMPLFVAQDSADVWAHQSSFLLDEQGQPTVVAGVPPDYFSATGQRWGNPHYRWESMEADGFAWWQARMKTQLTLFDILRIDHFRGLESYWEIPESEKTAIRGRWIKAPGKALLAHLSRTFSSLPLVAEDLGIITPEVNELRKQFNLPGMKIMQFAFDGGANNPYLPHNHAKNSVVYTGTHDNNTTVGWFNELDHDKKRYVYDYLLASTEPMPWALIRATLASVAKLAIIPMQDLLALGTEHRMNRPGTTDGNWQWRFQWEQVDSHLATRLKTLIQIYKR